MKNRLETLAFLILIFLGIWGVVTTMTTSYQQLVYPKGWQAISATIEKSEPEPFCQHFNLPWGLRVHYTFEVQNKPYHGSLKSYTCYRNAKAASSDESHFPQASTLTIYYNPQHPEQSAWYKWDKKGNLSDGIISLLLLALGIFAIKSKWQNTPRKKKYIKLKSYDANST